jgi:CubicO group peptidase (beta-lactamase class C family)
MGISARAEIVPSADIANSPNSIWQLESEHEGSSSFSFQHGGETYSLDQFVADTATDSFAILHRGKVIYEQYANGMTSNTPHILMSVSKSLTSIVAGILIKGALDPEQTVVSILSELKNSVYSDATVRHVLDMRVIPPPPSRATGVVIFARALVSSLLLPSCVK